MVSTGCSYIHFKTLVSNSNLRPPYDVGAADDIGDVTAGAAAAVAPPVEIREDFVLNAVAFLKHPQV